MVVWNGRAPSGRAGARRDRIVLMENFGRRQGGRRRTTVSGSGYVDLLIDAPT
jgi:hypothetical protein